MSLSSSLITPPFFRLLSVQSQLSPPPSLISLSPLFLSLSLSLLCLYPSLLLLSSLLLFSSLSLSLPLYLSPSPSPSPSLPLSPTPSPSLPLPILAVLHYSLPPLCISPSLFLYIYDLPPPPFSLHSLIDRTVCPTSSPFLSVSPILPFFFSSPVRGPTCLSFTGFPLSVQLMPV